MHGRHFTVGAPKEPKTHCSKKRQHKARNISHGKSGETMCDNIVVHCITLTARYMIKL